ncbi:hypothetical protein ANN_01542 [Periplaneta americana]|uniref:Uncharacterized protein n=1 Tax=Periplaneta americana TaxID=6978 RepID=A0ABQ8TXY8_PERAM|nr:hypothetical protein ANN_01542 [Periplaneta americana]
MLTWENHFTTILNQFNKEVPYTGNRSTYQYLRPDTTGRNSTNNQKDKTGKAAGSDGIYIEHIQSAQPRFL